MTDFDVNDPDRVASPLAIDADLGVGGRRLIVASGIGRPEWQIDTDEVTRGHDRVLLRIPADKIEQATVHVGLASISNDDSGYAFAVDEAALEVDPQGELVLGVKTAVMGEWSSLNRFSYQVVAVITRTVAEISGKITWPKRLFTPASTHPFDVAANVAVALNSRVTKPSDGPFGGEIETLTPIAAGEITAVTIGDDEVVALYRISHPQKSVPLRVTVAVTGFRTGGGESVGIGPVAPGADIFTLSVNDPGRSGVDFSILTTVVR